MLVRRSARLLFIILLAGIGSVRVFADEATATTAPAADATKAKVKSDDEYYELFKVLADTMDQVERNYVKDVSRRELMEAAIRGVLSKLDPYSNYVSPDDMSHFKLAVDNQYPGIGIQIDVRRGLLTVLSPIIDSPAYRAGIHAGDIITEIDDKSTEGINVDDAVRRLKGEAGTSVKIAVLHPGNKQPERISVTRELIQIETVRGDRRGSDDRWDFMLDHDKKIGYIRITSFNRDTPRDLKKALDQLNSQELRGLVLDLRFNPGGLLTSAIEVADMFLTDGEIVSTSGRNSPKRTWSAHKLDTYSGFPMAVLVNHHSASASEIVSAALQDHKAAVVVGERTWGKGSVQNVIELEGGKSILKLTTANYVRPSGHNIDRAADAKESDEWGVKPTPGYEVKLDDAERFQLQLVRRDRDILTAHADQSASEKPDGEKPGGEKPTADNDTADKDAVDKDATDKKPAESAAEKPAFVDRQLAKALEYLSTELAKAE